MKSILDESVFFPAGHPGGSKTSMAQEMGHIVGLLELALLVCPFWRDGQLSVLTGHPHRRPMWWVTAGTMASDCTSL